MVNLGTIKDKGKVSVVVTFCNLDNVAGRMLNSLVNQSYKNLEIVCVNDNSIDKTLEILNEFANNDDRIVVLSNKQNLGASRSRNIGIDHATGKYIIVLDGDDEMLLDGIANMVRAFDENTDCVVAGFKQTTQDGAINMVMPEEKLSGSPKDEKFFEVLMRYSNQSDVCCYTRMYLREKYKARYKEGCDYGEHLLVAMQNLEYLDNITMLPMVVYNYAPYPYPRQTMSNENKGKEFDLMKQVMPEIQSVTQKMFPKNKYLAYLSGFYLITTIFIGAKHRLESNQPREEVLKIVNSQLNDDMTQNLVEGLETKNTQDQTIKQVVELTKGENVLNEAISASELFVSQNYMSNTKLGERISMALFAGSIGQGTPTPME